MCSVRIAYRRQRSGFVDGAVRQDQPQYTSTRLTPSAARPVLRPMPLFRHLVTWALLLALAISGAATASPLVANATSSPCARCARPDLTMAIGVSRTRGYATASTAALASRAVRLPACLRAAGCVGKAACHFVGCLVLAPPGSPGWTCVPVTPEYTSQPPIHHFPDAARDLPYRPPRA